ncbi:MAG: hypothetical protein KAW12_14860 [Candidatus Aminicenantes bacterium]|nr:hypothetical protein [Candidatus Aminicenantes bacterium]
MKKLIFAVILIFLTASWSFSSGLSANLNINYNHGVSSFFDRSELQLTSSGLDFIESRQNRMGLGFTFSVNIPIYKRLYIVPGVSMNFGHQQYAYTQVGANGAGEDDTKNTYYFQLYSGEMSLLYDLLVLKNGWTVNLLLGLNYNSLKIDNETLVENQKYLGMQTAVGAKFQQLKHLGFQFFAYYKMPFAADLLAYVGAQGGISYNF